MASNNTTSIIDIPQVSKSIVDILNQVTQNFVIYLPLIFFIFGLIGFIGNVFTYLQVELRTNTCCIYSLCGSIIDIINLSLNSFPNYLVAKYGVVTPWYTSSTLCKVNLFLLVFLPHLSIHFLLMAIIDRFASTCSLTSPIQKMNQLKMVPWMIAVTVITSCLASLYAPILFDLIFEGWCDSTQPTITSVLYICLIGLMGPLLMFTFILLTYRNIRLSHGRVGGGNTGHYRRSRNQFIIMIFCQVFVTSFFSLQWIIMYAYFLITANDVRSNEQISIVFFVFTLTNYCYYLNNVKSFYLSILTCQLFRKTFIKGMIDLLPRRMRPRFQLPQTNFTINTVTKMKRGDTSRR